MGVPGAYPYPAETTISVNDELVHGIPGERRLEDGDIVSIDCGTVHEGFVGDSALTVGVGSIDAEAQKLIDVTRESLFAGIAKMVPGNRTGDVSAAIQQHVEAHGFEVVREYTGHGVGRSMHEDPQVPNYGFEGRSSPENGHDNRLGANGIDWESRNARAQRSLDGSIERWKTYCSLRAHSCSYRERSLDPHR